MFYAYVIKNVRGDFYYKGHCENLEERLKQHNSGMTESIRPYLPFTLVYFERFDTRKEAIKREKYFKNLSGPTLFESKNGSVVQSPDQTPFGRGYLPE